jgi:cytochrome c biogenesis protein
MKTFFKGVYRFIISTQLTIWLIIVLIFFMILGTIFPQGGSLEDYIAAFGHKAFMRIAPLGVLDIFHSWYFITTGIMLYLNLFLCMVHRIATGRKGQSAFGAKPSGAREIPVPGNAAAVREGLKRRGYHYRIAHEDNQVLSLFAWRGLPKRFVSICFHFFIGISIFGFVISAVTKFDGSIDFEVGDVHTVPTSSGDMALYRHFRAFDPEKVEYVEVELKDYEMQYLASGMGYFPKDYVSTLVARSRDREKEMRVEVNRPLKFGGLTFFQWSYGQRFTIAAGKDTLSLEAGDEFAVHGIAGTFMTRTVYVGKLFSDSAVSAIVPNAKLYYREHGSFEEIARLVEDEPVEVMGKEMVLKDVREVSGIFYKRDDGVPLLYAGFFLFMVGMCFRIFFHSYEIRLYFDRRTRAAYVKGMSSGLASSIEREIDEISNVFTGKA